MSISYASEGSLFKIESRFLLKAHSCVWCKTLGMNRASRHGDHILHAVIHIMISMIEAFLWEVISWTPPLSWVDLYSAYWYQCPAWHPPNGTSNPLQVLSTLMSSRSNFFRVDVFVAMDWKMLPTIWRLQSGGFLWKQLTMIWGICSCSLRKSFAFIYKVKKRHLIIAAAVKGMKKLRRSVFSWPSSIAHHQMQLKTTRQTFWLRPWQNSTSTLTRNSHFAGKKCRCHSKAATGMFSFWCTV